MNSFENKSIGYNKKTKRKKKLPLSAINVTPFVDITLVLMVIFMISAPMLDFSIPVSAPNVKSSQTTNTKKEDIFITIDQKAQIYLNNKKINITHLQDKIKAIKFGNHQATIFIKADKRLQYKNIANIIDIASMAGFNKISLVFNNK